MLLHRGQTAQMPGKFDHGTATYLLSRLDYPAAQRLCSGEQFDPIPLRMPGAPPCAAGFVATIDYHQTDVGRYREWILGIWVAPRGERSPQPEWVNATSLAFYALQTGGQAFTFFAPKMILTEALPTEVGVEHYGIPKEVGHVQLRTRRAADAMRSEQCYGSMDHACLGPHDSGLLRPTRIAALPGPCIRSQVVAPVCLA